MDKQLKDVALYYVTEWINKVRKVEYTNSKVDFDEIRAVIEMALMCNFNMNADFMHELADVVDGKYIVSETGSSYIKW